MARPLGGTWNARIKRFLAHDDRWQLPIGERTVKWVHSLNEDIQRWKLPVKCVPVSPMKQSGKIRCAIERTAR